MKTPSEQPPQPPAEDAVSLQDILNPPSKVSSLSTFGHVLWLKRYVILIVWMLIGIPLAVFLALYDIPKTYWTSVSLRFPKLVGEERSMVQDISITELESINTLFKSHNVMAKTIDNMGLQFRIITNNVFRNYVVQSVQYGKETPFGLYKFKFAPGRRLTVTLKPFSKSMPKSVAFEGMVPPDGVVAFSGFTFKFVPSILEAGNSEVEAYFLPMPMVIKDLRKRMGVKALDQESNVKVNYTIFLEDRDPFYVADVLNELVKNFIAVFDGTTEVQDINVLGKMEKNLELARQNEKKAQDALAEFYIRFPALQESAPQGNAYAIVNAQSEKTKQTERRDELAQLIARRGSASTPEQQKLWLMDAVNLLQSFSMVQVITLQTQIRDLEAKKEELGKTYSPTHPKVMEAEQQILALCADADKLLTIAQSTVDKRLERLNREIVGYLPKNVPVTTDLEAKRLTQEKENASRIVENLRMEFDRAKLSTGGNMFKVTIVDAAREPEFQPDNLKRRLLFAFIALLAGVFPGVFWFAGKQVFFSRIWNRDDASRKLKVKVLGSTSYTGSTQKMSESKKERGEVEDRLLYSGESSSLPQIESYRSLRAEVENYYGFTSDPGHSALIITSTQPWEGKSLFSANLAVSFARKNRRTLLIDADFRHGRQEKIFKLEANLGLSDILEESGLSDESQRDLLFGTIIPTHENNLLLLANGKRLGGGVEAITQAKINAIIALLKSDFDVIIVDTPPVIVTADAFNLMKVIPNVLFVVRSGFTPSTDAEEAIDLIKNRNAKIGCVVTAVQESPFIKNHFNRYGLYYAS
jgi:capsular exopolysaccharide synthesis family protein